MAANPNWNALYSNQGIRFNGNPALDELRQTYATQQAQKQKDNDNFTAQIAKLNFGGAKDADLDYLHKSYGDILGTFGKLRQTNDPKERAQLGLELQQKQNGFLFDVEKSKDANKQLMDLAHLPLNPNANLADGATDKITELGKTSTFHPSYQDAYKSTVSNLFDKPYDVEGTTKKLFDNVTHDASKSDVIQKEKGGGERVISTKGTATDKQDFINSVFNKAKADKNYMHNIVKSTGIEDPAEALHTYADRAYETYNKDNNSIQKMGAVQNKPDLYYTHRDYAVTHPVMGAANTPNYFQNLTTAMKGGDPTAINEFVNNIPATQFKEGEKPSVTVENGQQVLHIPAKVVLDKKVAKDMDDVKKAYEDSPDKKGGILGTGILGDKVPFEQSDKYKTDYLPLEKKLYATKEREQSIPLPSNLDDYRATLSQVASKNGLSYSAMNAVNKSVGAARVGGAAYTNQTTGTDSKGNKITIGYKNGSWYDVKTGKKFE